MSGQRMQASSGVIGRMRPILQIIVGTNIPERLTLSARFGLEQ